MQNRRIFLALALAAAPAFAVDMTWNDTSSDFNAGGSWTNGLPGTNDAAVFPADADTNIVFQPNLTADIAIRQLRFKDAASFPYILTADPGRKLTLTGTGSGNTAGTGAALVGVNNGSSNVVAAPVELGAGTGSTQYFRAHQAGGMTLVSGDVTEANPGIRLVAEGVTTAILRLAGSNSFSGGLTLNGTILEVGGDHSIPGAGTLVFSGGALRSSDRVSRSFVNPFTLSGTLTFGAVTAGNQGNLVFSGGGALAGDFSTTVSSANPAPVSAVAFEGPIGETGGSRSLTVVGSTSGQGYGYLFLLGANTFSGKTVINSSGIAGPVVINSLGLAGDPSGSLGAPAGANRVIELAVGGVNQSSSGAYLRYIGGATATDRPLAFGHAGAAIQVNNATLDASGYGPITFLSNLTVQGTSTGGKNLRLDGTSRDSNTFAGSIPDNSSTGSGKLGLTKNGTGTWVLKGTNGFTGGLTLTGGRLVLDYSNGVALASANALTLGAGELALKAAAGGSSAQVLGNAALTTLTGGRLVLDSNGGSMALTLGGTWTRNTAATLYLEIPAGAEVAAAPALASDILAYTIVKDGSGTGFASTNLAGRLVRYTYAPGQLLTSVPPSSATTNLYLSGGSLDLNAAGSTWNSLAIDTTGGGALGLGGATRSLAGGILTHGSGGFVISNGTLAATSSSGEWLFHQYADGVVELRGNAGNANNNLGKTGPGTLALAFKGGAGFLRIYEGAVRAEHDSVLTNYWSGQLRYIILNGGVLELAGSGDCSNSVGPGARNIQFLGDGGFSAYGATRAVRLNNGTGTIEWGSANFVPANNALLLSGRDANALLDFQNGLGFGNQQRVVRVEEGSAPVDARLSGALSGNYGGGLIKEGPGTLELTAANGYPGETWVLGGALLVNNGPGTGTGSGRVIVFNGGVIGGTGAVHRLVLSNGGALRPTQAGVTTAPLKVSGALSLEAGSVLDLSGLTGLGAGTHTLAQGGSRSGTFGTVSSPPPGFTLLYTADSVLLKKASAGAVIQVR